MAQYTVNYRCGHSEKVALFGKYADRESRIKSLEAGDCPACRLAARLAKANSTELPSLTGSDKQIVWAADIRAKFCEACKILKDMSNGKEDEPHIKSLLDFLDETTKNTDAKFWIDNRDSLMTDRSVFDLFRRTNMA